MSVYTKRSRTISFIVLSCIVGGGYLIMFFTAQKGFKHQQKVASANNMQVQMLRTGVDPRGHQLRVTSINNTDGRVRIGISVTNSSAKTLPFSPVVQIHLVDNQAMAHSVLPPADNGNVIGEPLKPGQTINGVIDFSITPGTSADMLIFNADDTASSIGIKL